MSEKGPDKRRSNSGSSPAEAGGASGDSRPLPWLLRQKISIPERVAGHLDRVDLEDRVMPTRRRLTVLNAPGGFGKTTLLAECCRHLRKDGIPVAWISVDEQDEPEVLDTYITIAFACQSAVAGTSVAEERPATPEHGEAFGGTEHRTAFAMREVASLELPFVLVFDELERLPAAQTRRHSSISCSSAVRPTCTSRSHAGSCRAAWTLPARCSRGAPRWCRQRICGSQGRRLQHSSIENCRELDLTR